MTLRTRIAAFAALASLTVSALPIAAVAYAVNDPKDVNRNTRIKQVKVPIHVLEGRAKGNPLRARSTLKTGTGDILSPRYIGDRRLERAKKNQLNSRQAKVLKRLLERAKATGTGSVQGAE